MLFSLFDQSVIVFIIIRIYIYLKMHQDLPLQITGSIYNQGQLKPDPVKKKRLDFLQITIENAILCK